MHHPLEKLTPSQRVKAFWALLALTVIIMLVFAITGAPMNTDAAPQGIVSFEVAGSVSRAEAMLASWDTPAQLAAAFGLGFDYLFMPAYSTTVALGCIMAAGVLRRAKWPLASAGASLAWGLWAAALFDALENVALTIEMLSGVAAPWPQVAWVCAMVKFTLLIAGLIYAFYGLAARLFVRVS